MDYNFKYLGNPMRLPANMEHFRRRSAPELIRFGFTSLYRVSPDVHNLIIFSVIFPTLHFCFNSILSLQGCQQILLAGDLLAEEDNKIEIEVAKVRSELEEKLRESEKNCSAAVSKIEKWKTECRTH